MPPADREKGGRISWEVRNKSWTQYHAPKKWLVISSECWMCSRVANVNSDILELKMNGETKGKHQSRRRKRGKNKQGEEGKGIESFFVLWSLREGCSPARISSLGYDASFHVTYSILLSPDFEAVVLFRHMPWKHSTQ